MNSVLLQRSLRSRLLNWAGLVVVACSLCTICTGQNLHIGDLDDDGVVTVRDLALLNDHISETPSILSNPGPFDAKHAVLADLNKDGAVNSADREELIKEILHTRNPEQLPLGTIRFSSPTTGEGDVSVNRETIVHFTVPLALNATLDTTKFSAEFAGRKVLSRVEISSDRKKASLFYLEPLPANSRVKVTFDGSALTDLIGRGFDADGDGVSGGTYRMSFDTQSNAGIPATGITGRVLLAAPEGSATVPAGFVEKGVVGVTITVDGQEQTMRTTTNAQGYFTLSPCPTGVFFVHIDGRTSTSPASHYPDGRYFPVVGKQWEAVAGKADNLAAGTGLIYLPCVCPSTLQPTSQTQETTVNFPQQVLTMNPSLAGTSVDIPSNAVFSDDGTRGGKIGIAPVPSDRLPSPLPPGLNLPLVITVQSDGATNLDRPAPVTFPNLPDPVTGIKPGPGEKSALWSFNHDTGQWEVVGPMTVTADGNFVKTDAGVGIRQPGWHGAMPGTQNALSPGKFDPIACAEKVADAVKKALEAKKAFTNLLKPLAAAARGAESGALIGAEIGSLIPGAGTVVGGAVGAIAGGVVGFIGSQTISDLSKSGIIKKGEDILKKAVLNGVSILDKKIIDGDISGMAFQDARDGVLDSLVASIQTMAHPFYSYGKDVDKFGEKINELGQSADSVLQGCLGLAPLFSPASPGAAPQQLPDALLPSLATSYGLPQPTPEAVEEFNHGAQDSRIYRDSAPPALRKLNDEGDLLAEIMVRSSNPNPTLDDVKIVRDKMKIFLENYDSSVGNFRSNIAKDFDDIKKSTDDAISAFGNFNPTKSLIFYEYKFNDLISRTRSDNGDIRVILPPETYVEILAFDPSSGAVGRSIFLTGSNGQSTNQGKIVMLPDTSLDGDGDGLSDLAEDIIGTDAQNPDTDNDGVSDGAELKNGSDPLSGIAAATGIVGKAETGGDCRDVAAVNDVLAAVCGTEGLQLLGVRQGLSPTKLSKVPSSSPATVVAMTGSLVAVGMGDGGTMIVDASTPDTPQVLRTIKLGSSVKSLAAVENTVYIGFDDGRITAVDMLTGRLLANVNVGSAVHDLAIGNGVLYAATAGNLKTIPISATGTFGSVSSLAMPGSVGAGGQRLRLSRGVDRLYLVHTNGYNVFNLASPSTPVLIRNNTDTQFGWRHLVANGSGLALAAVGPNSTSEGAHDVSLYDLGPDNAQANFLTNFPLPGSAYGSVFYNGLAYVADGSAGVQVVNVRPFDSLKVPPTITLSAQSVGGSVVEGAFVPVSALVTDDVQVRNVEFYVDDVKMETDGNFPFEARVSAARRTDSKTTMSLKAKATDTGGNSAWSNTLTLNLSLETDPPTVLGMQPPNGQFIAQCSGFTVKFSEPVKTSTLTSSTVRFYSSGADGRIGTDDDSSVTAALLPASSGSGANRDTASWQTSSPLAPGTYRVLVTLGVQDTAGNALATPFSSIFIVSSGIDSDGDCLSDDVEIALGYDPGNQDSNGNGKADGDEDSDGDGLSNAFELRYGIQPNNPDSNGNGTNDSLEDSDRDGLTNAQEQSAGSDPNKADTDGDGWPDFVELEFHSNPTDAKSKPLGTVVNSVQTDIVPMGTFTAKPPVTTVSDDRYRTYIASPPIEVNHNP